MTKRILAGLVILAILGAGIWYFMVPNNGQDEQGAAPGGQNRAVSVAALEITPKTITKKTVLPGRVTAFRQAIIRPQISGIITERLFEEGSDVEKGEQLYQIDPTPYEAELASARADLESARANIKSIESRAERYKELVEINAVSRQEYDDIKAQQAQAQASIAVAKAAVDVADVNLAYTRVYAPISGRIGRSNVTEGALVNANQQESLAVITQLDPVYIDMTQPGNEAMRLRALMAEKREISVEVQLENTDYTPKGSLQFSDVTVDETTGTVALRAIVPNPDQILLPGLFVHAALITGSEEALLIPQRATVRGQDGGLTVWVVQDDNTAAPRAITVERAHNDQWIVQDGINAGDRVIIEGYQKVAPGAAVSPTPWVKSAKEDAEAAAVNAGDRETVTEDVDTMGDTFPGNKEDEAAPETSTTDANDEDPAASPALPNNNDNADSAAQPAQP